MKPIPVERKSVTLIEIVKRHLKPYSRLFTVKHYLCFIAILHSSDAKDVSFSPRIYTMKKTLQRAFGPRVAKELSICCSVRWMQKLIYGVINDIHLMSPTDTTFLALLP